MSPRLITALVAALLGGGASGGCYEDDILTESFDGSVTVIPSSAVLAVGDTLRFRAELRDAEGNPLSGRAVSWHSTDTIVLRITGESAEHATVRAVARGAARLRATSQGATGEAWVTVN
ncbi:MAG TPA: Ig-like domain-containing protein [Gemmatimonadales bacterium]|nr:Ig-like domain-containing protein [Gemmatimonadales bacterium]